MDQNANRLNSCRAQWPTFAFGQPGNSDFTPNLYAGHLDLKALEIMGSQLHFLENSLVYRPSSVFLLQFNLLLNLAGYNFFSGLFQSTGWPCVVAVMGNWFGKSR